MNRMSLRLSSRAVRTAMFVLFGSLAVCGLAVADGQSTALPDPALDAPLAKTSSQAVAVVAGGCFWGVQGVFSHVNGVISATSGYAGGPQSLANYETVSTGTTGHAESVKVVYDPSKISYGQLLKVYFSVATDPTQLNRQGPDSGTQYRGVIFTDGAEEARIADAYVKQLTEAHVYKRPIVTQVVPLQGFYAAEDYHQNYLALHPTSPYIMINDLPKVAALKSTFPNIYR
jgi:peptide-methionine (S)-S-oxide reductase